MDQSSSSQDGFDAAKELALLDSKISMMGHMVGNHISGRSKAKYMATSALAKKE